MCEKEGLQTCRAELSFLTCEDNSCILKYVTLTNTPIFAFPYSCYTTTFVNNLDTNFDFDRQHGVKRSKDGSSQPKPMSVEEDAQLTEYKRLNQTSLSDSTVVTSTPGTIDATSFRNQHSQPSERLDADELAFSGQQIEANFSNFSAWHYRSKLLRSQLDQYDHIQPQDDGGNNGVEDRVEKDKILKSELEWVRGALWIDPNDQSAWLYHRWLLSQTRDEQIQTDEYASIAELLEVEPDAKWAIAALILARPVEYAHLLDRLIALDPLRKQRYLDLVRPQSPS
ncbi:hypothetical protein KEM48_011424 [Puccinia striiformis f. sp. tritici PST-130]|nr:hypothetical protein KEM48_011424 [Puccinia striiformis f. sp. tritici PST-130]